MSNFVQCHVMTSNILENFSLIQKHHSNEKLLQINAARSADAGQHKRVCRASGAGPETDITPPTADAANNVVVSDESKDADESTHLTASNSTVAFGDFNANDATSS